MRRRILGCALLVAGCGDPVLSPIIEVPDPSSPGYPFSEGSELDDLLLEIARQGDELPLVQRRGAPGDPPELDSVPFGEDLVVHLSGRDSGVIAAYGRTCAIDFRSDGDASERSPRLYFSLTTNWGTVQTPEEPVRIGGHAFSLPDGSALYFGGSGVRSVERFDPLSDATFDIVDLIAERESAVSAAIGSAGQVLLVGGHHRDNVDAFVEQIEVIGAQGVVAVEGPQLRDHAAASLADGSVVVAGGVGPAGVTGEAIRYQLGDTGLQEQSRSQLTLPRRLHTLTRVSDGRLIIAGGLDASGSPVAELESFQPSTDGFAVEGGTQPVSLVRWGHQAIGVPGRQQGIIVVIIGGMTIPDGATEPEPAREIVSYDPITEEVASVHTLPEGSAVDGFSLTPLPDGSVLVAGGRDPAGEPLASAARLRFDPASGQIRYLPTTSLAFPRAGHSATQLCDGTVLIVGGTDEPTPAERYNPELKGRR